MNKQAEKKKELIQISFPFNWEDVNNVKTLQYARFHNNTNPKYWTCQITTENLVQLKIGVLH